MGRVAAMTPLLETRGLSKRFGGLEAVRGIDLRLDRGEVRALIGPNGAGKTTLIGLISGRVRPTAGTVHFAGRDVTGIPVWERAVLGIGYTFQVTSIYRNLSVYDNVALAAQRRRLRTPLDWIAPGREAVAAAAEAALMKVGLGDLARQRAGALAYGHQRVLEVAMALALGPALLLLDEPTQGLSGSEIEALCRLVRSLAGTTTILLIEHNMPVVLDLAGRVTVMDRGQIIAEGAPAEIEANPEVQRAYLGR
jgi:branched-chain amino acid transport system ATP-binding protein